MREELEEEGRAANLLLNCRNWSTVDERDTDVLLCTT
jgi:hypothetical protein